MATANNHPQRRGGGGSGNRASTPPRSGADAPANRRVPDATVTLSNTSVFPQNVDRAFEFAEELGYGGVEIMPTIVDPSSRKLDHLRDLRDRYSVPITSIHAPCLGPQTAGVWGWDPWRKLERSAEVAKELGAKVVVVHPPFWWQHDYADRFVEVLADMQGQTDIRFAVENMFPRKLLGHRPHWNPAGPRWATLDVSHAAASGSDVLAMADALGERLTHVHFADSETNRDKHLVPGRGDQPCGMLLEQLAESGYRGDICIEVNTSTVGQAERRRHLAKALAFVERHWPSPR